MKSGKYTLDRFEGDLGVLLLRDDESYLVEILKDRLESFAKQGDILNIKCSDKGDIENIEVLENETRDVRIKVKTLVEKLKNKNN